MKLNRHAYKKGSYPKNGKASYGWRLQRQPGYPWFPARMVTKVLSFILQKDICYRSVGGEVSYNCGKRHSAGWRMRHRWTIRDNHKTRGERNRRAHVANVGRWAGVKTRDPH